jgi:hypothetical protein
LLASSNGVIITGMMPSTFFIAVLSWRGRQISTSDESQMADWAGKSNPT